MIVVDSNVLAYLYLPCEHTAAAEALLEQDPDWAAPLLWRSEFRNILAGYMRRKALSFEQAERLQSEAESLLEGLEYEVAPRAVFELVRGSDCSAYDCEFVALALKLDTRLVTLEKKSCRLFRRGQWRFRRHERTGKRGLPPIVPGRHAEGRQGQGSSDASEDI